MIKRNYGRMLDHYFWFIVKTLPIIFFIVTRFQNPDISPDFFAYVDSFSPFTLIKDIFDQITTIGFNQTFAISSYLSYVFGVELFHVFYDVSVFIPRLAHKWIGKAVQDD